MLTIPTTTMDSLTLFFPTQPAKMYITPQLSRNPLGCTELAKLNLIGAPGYDEQQLWPFTI